MSKYDFCPTCGMDPKQQDYCISELEEELAQKDAEIARLEETLSKQHEITEGYADIIARLTKGMEVISNSFHGATECPNCGEAATIAEYLLEDAVYLGSDTEESGDA